MKPFILVILILTNFSCFSQRIDSLDIKRLWISGTVDAIAISGTFMVLNQLWYKDYPSSKMHWFDDSKEWFQMDKLGHAFTSYHFSSLYTEQMRWCGLSKKKASIIGSSLSFLTVSTVELLDAKSLKWGASVSDLSANLVGSALYLIQQSIWDDQKIQFKYSFHQNFYSKYRANLLGENLAQNLIKDYNGQTYWLSLNAKTIFTQEWMPQWLNISVGYSAKGMLGAHINPEGLPYFKRARQYFLSLDIDLRQIPVRSKALKKVFRLLNVIKFPMPAIELRSGQIKAHYLYF